MRVISPETRTAVILYLGFVFRKGTFYILYSRTKVDGNPE